MSERDAQSDGSLTGSCLVLADSNYYIGRVLRSSVQIVIDDLLDTIGVSDLGVEGCPGVVRYHPVTTTQGVLHGPPWVVAGSRLDVPDIPGVPPELAAPYSSGDCVFITDRATSGVHQPCTPLKMLEQLGIDQPTGTLMKRSVNGNNVTLGDEFLGSAMRDWTVGSSQPLKSP